jgi:DNA invertase Pin-like site-specific DNA recombinase
MGLFVLQFGSSILPVCETFQFFIHQFIRSVTGNGFSGDSSLLARNAVADLERDIIRERVNVGLAPAKSRGIKLDRPSFPNLRKAEVNALFQKGAGVRAISRKLKMAPPSSVHSLLSKRRTKRSNCNRVFD